ncbi:MAG: DMT family transporter [Rhodospirillales bacterium]|nr:DMT family transporter [Rhodospirillales bacterium]
MLSPYFLLLVTTASWAGNVVVARAFHQDIPPMSMTFWRWGVAAAAMLPFVAPRIWEHRATIRRHWRPLLVLAATGVAGFQACLYVAVNTTTAINAGLFFALMPIAIPVSSYLMYRERVTKRQGAGLALSFIGMVIIITRAEPSALVALRFTPGDIWMLGVVASWAVYSPLLKRLPESLPPMTMLTVITLLGMLVLLPFYAWELGTVGGFALDTPNLLAFAFMGLIASVLAYSWWNRAVSLIGANRAGAFLYLVPVLTVLMGVFLLGETIRPFHVAGAVFILGGICLAMRAPSGGRAPANPGPAQKKRTPRAGCD